ncbi:MAG: DUF4190 domain-containing protein [Nonomuraea sp.]|nr:DUF4190 domain-containing protein [Nonomuraea sp.]NUP69335.1 DUF4190 domain-containing protein [Nonomuraea sp.]NUP78835.1 DUF4190 domain-containing protein [Nonomuraea sp.]NUS05528.1 DUF4190 domain-containing protein [Nonomuraea sp.]
MSYPEYGPSYYGPPPQTHPNGTTILVLGILSLVVCGLIGPFAWSMGNKALKEIDGSGYPYENRSAVQAGRVCGMIATIMLMIGVAFMVFGVGAAILSASFS